MTPDRIKEIEDLIADNEERLKESTLQGDNYGECEHLFNMGAALRELIEERKWRTIDSAPKDGTPIDLWVIVDGWQDEKRIPNCTWGWMRKWGGEEVQGWVGLGNLHEDRVPTHWMPLPSPPPEHTP